MKKLELSLFAALILLGMFGCSTQQPAQQGQSPSTGQTVSSGKAVLGDLKFTAPAGFVDTGNGKYYAFGSKGTCNVEISQSSTYKNPSQAQDLDGLATAVKSGIEGAGGNVLSISKTSVNSGVDSYKALMVNASIGGVDQIQFIVALKNRFAQISYGTSSACAEYREEIFKTITSIGEV